MVLGAVCIAPILLLFANFSSVVKSKLLFSRRFTSGCTHIYNMWQRIIKIILTIYLFLFSTGFLLTRNYSRRNNRSCFITLSNNLFFLCTKFANAFIYCPQFQMFLGTWYTLCRGNHLPSMSCLKST